MKKWLERLRGALGTGLTWAAADVADIGLTEEEKRELLAG